MVGTVCVDTSSLVSVTETADSEHVNVQHKASRKIPVMIHMKSLLSPLVYRSWDLLFSSSVMIIINNVNGDAKYKFYVSKVLSGVYYTLNKLCVVR